MKIIKSLLAVSISIGASVALQAQQPEEKKVNPLPAALTKSPAADLKSEPVPVTQKIKADAAMATPSPLTREDNAKIPGQENVTMKTLDSKTTASQLTNDQEKILNGKATLPKQSAIVSGSDNTTSPVVLPKPVLAKEQ
jgi:hypothetical protein